MATILIVDDSNYARRTHRKVLESDGHTVLEASTGMGAIESYFVHHPDLVLLDLTMEDMSGLDLLARLHELEPGARVVILSADVQRSTAKLAADSGALRFLAKPVTADELLETVRSLVTETPT